MRPLLTLVVALLSLVGCVPEVPPAVPEKPEAPAKSDRDLAGRATHIQATLAVRPDGTVTGTMRIDNAPRNVLFAAPAVTQLEATAASAIDRRDDGFYVVDGHATVRYTAKPKRGLSIHEHAIYTHFHTWHWLPSPKNPSHRSTLSLRATGPQGWTAIATGDGPHAPGPDIVSHVSHPSYTFGFALLKTTDIQEKNGLVVVNAGERAALVHERTEGIAGRMDAAIGYRSPRYVSVFLPGKPKQELAGMAFLPESYLTAIANDPREDWLLVHEYAHQMFGNLLTAKTWGDFWLNEGMAVWWVGFDKGERGEPEGFARERSLWERRLRKGLDRGDNAAITRPGVAMDEALDTVVYHGGALVIDEGNRRLGRDVFLRRLRALSKTAEHGRALGTDAWLSEMGLTELRPLVWSARRVAH